MINHYIQRSETITWQKMHKFNTGIEFIHAGPTQLAKEAKEQYRMARKQDTDEELGEISTWGFGELIAIRTQSQLHHNR